MLVVLLALFTFFQFLEEIKFVGKGRYDMGKAFIFVAMTLPTLAYQLLPITLLLGCTIGLGVLASNSELTAIRSAGVSLEQIVGSVFKITLMVIVVESGLLQLASKMLRQCDRLRGLAIYRLRAVKDCGQKTDPNILMYEKYFRASD